MTSSAEKPSATRKHVVIVGGGFAGLSCARKLAARANVRITLIDKNNYQQFQPLFYQVAAAILSPGNAAFALRNVLLPNANVEVKLAEATSADLTARTVITADGHRYQGAYLVLAAGAQVNFFGTPGADRYAHPLYSLEDAERLRSRLLAGLESVDRDPPLVATGVLNVVVVGAGPTGVEIAGALGDFTQRMPPGLYKNVDLRQAQVFLVDKVPAVLNTFSRSSQTYAVRALQARGVQVRLGVAVEEVTASDVLLGDGTRIPTHTVIWAGGLKASSLSRHIGVKPGQGGRIEVQSDFSVQGFPGVYALGDFANIAGADGKPLPQLASVAQQAGRYCAGQIGADIAGKAGKPFRYVDKGIMAMIGRNAAVAEVGARRRPLTGPLAFAAWLGVHAVLLTTGRARIEAVLEWAWDYFGNIQINPVLDRPDQRNMDGDADGAG